MPETHAILVIEDEAVLNNSYSKFLESEGYSVKTAKNGEEGITVLETFSPHLILLDLNMPVLDGVGFLEKSQIKKQKPETRVIVFSNSEDDVRIEKAFEQGADRYLLKAMLAPQELSRILKEELGA